MKSLCPAFSILGLLFSIRQAAAPAPAGHVHNPGAATPLRISSASGGSLFAQPHYRQYGIHEKTAPERMLFDVKRFAVKPGQPVKLVFMNPDAMQHNLVIVKPGALEEVGMAGNEMAKDPDGIKKHFVPQSDKVLHATKLIDPQATAILRFKATLEPGEYPVH